MNELFLHYIWQFQKFDSADLSTTEGHGIHIIDPGRHNEDSGPDFFDAKVRIDNLTWAGKVEIHIKSSDWISHNHQKDQNYDNVILHVVWNEDKEIYNSSHERIPTIELKNRISPALLNGYRKLVNYPTEIPCEPFSNGVEDIQRSSMLERTLVERLKLKAKGCLEVLEKTNNDWEEMSYRVISRAFGAHLNQDNFSRLSQSLKLSLIRKHAGNENQVFALLYGQGGFLEGNISDEYFQKLHSEYSFLTKKYGLTQNLSRYQWRFHRLRPPNFPTLRLAHLANIVNRNPNLYSLIMDSSEITDFREAFKTRLPDYWCTHYDFGKETTGKKFSIGSSFLNSIIINAAIPVLVASSSHFDRQDCMDKALSWIEKIEAENNKITRLLSSAGFYAHHAGESQGMIHLYNEYCLKKRCLACNIGVSILKN